MSKLYTRGPGSKRESVETVLVTEKKSYGPRPVLLCLTLRAIIGTKVNLLLKHGFSMVQLLGGPGSFNVPHLNRREKSQDSTKDTPVSAELGELVHKTTKYHKRTVVRTRSRSNSPLPSARPSVNPSPYAGKLKALSKIFQKYLNKRFLQFQVGGHKGALKKICLQRILNILKQKMLKKGLRAFGSGKSDFCLLKNLNLASLSSENSKGKSQNFEEKDREIWRKRHPIRRHSPNPSNISTQSTPFSNIFSNSEQNSPRLSNPTNPFIVERRNTRRSTLPKEETEIFKEEVGKEEKKTGDFMGKKKGKALRSGKPGKEPVKNLVDTKKIRNMVESIQDNHRSVEKHALDRIKLVVDQEKEQQQLDLTGVLCDFLQIVKEKQETEFKKDCFAAIKAVPAKKKIETPQFGKKKTALRAGKGTKTPDINEFAQKIEVLNHVILKNKLTSFVAILESEKKSSKQLPALRNVYRIMDAKRFSKSYLAFYDIKKAANQRFNQKSKRNLRFFQSLHNLFRNSEAKSQKKVFSSLKKHCALHKLSKTLTKLQFSSQTKAKPQSFYALRSFSDQQHLKSKLKQLKIRHFCQKFYFRKLALGFV